MENATIERMMMTVNVKDVSDKSSCIGFIGFGIWFNGKDFMVAQYKSSPTKWYFFVYDAMNIDERLIENADDNFSYGQRVSELAPSNGHVNGSTFIYDSATDTMLHKIGTDWWCTECNSPSFLFEIS